MGKVHTYCLLSLPWDEVVRPWGCSGWPLYSPHSIPRLFQVFLTQALMFIKPPMTCSWSHMLGLDMFAAVYEINPILVLNS